MSKKKPKAPASNDPVAAASNTSLSAAERYERFAREWVIDHNATRAAIASGYSEKTAESQGSRLLRNVKVREIIDRLEREVRERLDITKEKVEREIASMAFIDIRTFYRDDGTIKPPREWTREEAAAVASMEVEEMFEGRGKDRVWVGYVKKIKLWPRLEANAILGAPHGVGMKRMEVGKPGEFEAVNDRKVLEKRVTERAARLGMVVKFPGKKAA